MTKATRTTKSTHEHTEHPKVNSDVNHSLQMKGQGVHGKSLYLPFNFAVNTKLLFKRKKKST